MGKTTHKQENDQVVITAVQRTAGGVLTGSASEPGPLQPEWSAQALR